MFLQSISFIQQEQFNLNQGKSLWNKVVSGPVAQQALDYSLTSDPQTQRLVSQAKQTFSIPRYVLLCPTCVQVCSQSHPCLNWLLQVLSYDGKQASISQYLSAEETQATGILVLVPTVTETQYVALSIPGGFCFVFSFFSFLTGSRKTNFFYSLPLWSSPIQQTWNYKLEVYCFNFSSEYIMPLFIFLLCFFSFR